MPPPRSTHPLLDAAVDTAPVGMAVLDGDMRYLHINPTLAELNGLPPEQHIGRRVEEVLPPDGVERVVAAIRQVMATGAPAHGVEFRRGTADDPRALEASYFPIGGERGVTAVGALVLDMTERDRALARARYLARASAVLGS